MTDFINPKTVPNIEIIYNNYSIIKSEYQQIKNFYRPEWPEKDIHNGNWTVFGLIALGGQKIEENTCWCPGIISILELFGGNIFIAGFSVLEPHTEIYPHVGYTEKVIRFHLGIEIPVEDSKFCGIQVGDSISGWKEKELLIFDDTTLHSAWNRTDQPRVVLLFDVKKEILG